MVLMGTRNAPRMMRIIETMRRQRGTDRLVCASGAAMSAMTPPRVLAAPGSTGSDRAPTPSHRVTTRRAAICDTFAMVRRLDAQNRMRTLGIGLVAAGFIVQYGA